MTSVQSQPRLLVAEDDGEIRQALDRILTYEGYNVITVNDGAAALEAIGEHQPDAILLDVMMPFVDGLGVCRKLRERGDRTPVLMLTAKGTDIDRVVGLEIGADDYLPKPFNDRELIARIRAILRRTAEPKAGNDTAELDPGESDQVRHSDLLLYPRRQEAWADDALLALTATEFTLLLELVRHSGEVVSKELLSQEVLGKKLMPFDRSLESQSASHQQ